MFFMSSLCPCCLILALLSLEVSLWTLRGSAVKCLFSGEFVQSPHVSDPEKLNTERIKTWIKWRIKIEWSTVHRSVYRYHHITLNRQSYLTESWVMLMFWINGTPALEPEEVNGERRSKEPSARLSSAGFGYQAACIPSTCAVGPCMILSPDPKSWV